jgi:hypothetical protein
MARNRSACDELSAMAELLTMQIGDSYDNDEPHIATLAIMVRDMALILESHIRMEEARAAIAQAEGQT